jgi:hypothetical protein
VLTFNSEGHVYFWEGKEVPSVSKILKTIGITRDFERVDEFYRQRGTFVHKAVEFHVKHTLDESTLDPENVLPYLRAYKKFEEQEGYIASKCEVPLYSKKYGFAGTIDQISEFEDNGLAMGEGICDIKATESSDKAADLQLCLYAQLYFENFGCWPSFRMVLELHGDETAKPLFYKTNPKIVKSIMELYQWKSTRRKR